MKNIYKGSHSIITEEDRYYDGFDLGGFDEKYVSKWMMEGTNDCAEYIENVIDKEYLWYKNQNKNISVNSKKIEKYIHFYENQNCKKGD